MRQTLELDRAALRSIGKRRLVLERLAQEFEPGLRYSERQVNRIRWRSIPTVPPSGAT